MDIEDPGGDPAAGADRRTARLERAFGDPQDAANPLGNAAVLAADDRGEVLAGARRILQEQHWSAEFVPRALGGRLERLDELGRLLRPVFRRDASLGFGDGLVGFIAAVPVWTAGSAEQRRWAAGILLDGGRLAVVRHRTAHGNAFVRDEFAATRHGGGHLLNGTKTVVANAAEAAGLVVIARTGGDAGRSHSVLLLDRGRLPAGRLSDLPRHATAGMRGVAFGGLRASDCPAPDDAPVGPPGAGHELSLRSSSVIRGLLPSMALAGVDTALRATGGFAVRARADGRCPLDVRSVKELFCGVFLDLLLSDCVALVATRAVHLLPAQASGYAAVAAYLAHRVLGDAMDDLASVLGGARYAAAGTYGMFQKLYRDVPVPSLGHAGSVGRQATILSRLPLAARDGWLAEPEPPAGLFRLHEDLPPLDLARSALSAAGDPLIGTLLAGSELVEREGDFGGHPECAAALRTATRALIGELRSLREQFGRLDPADPAALADPHAFALADRYALVAAAAACLGVWRAARDAPHPRADSFLADPGWPAAALHRVCRLLGLAVPDRPAAVSERILAEVLGRLDAARSFDLYDTPLAG